MKAFISLRTQYDNLGDEVINALLVRELAVRMPVIAITDDVPDWYIDSFRRVAGVKFSTRGSASFCLRLLATSLVPGVNWLFTSPGDTSSDGINSMRDHILRGLITLPGLKLASVGASFSRLSIGHIGALQKAIAHNGAITVRDARSRAVAAIAGVNLPVVPDLAFLLERRPYSGGTLGLLSLRDCPGLNQMALLQHLTGLVAAMRANELLPVISWQVGRDRKYCLELAERLGIDVVDAPQPRPSLEEAGRLYQRCRVVVSNRLHVLLIAAAYGAIPLPLLPLSETKVRGAFESVALDDLIGEPETFATHLSLNLARAYHIEDRLETAFKTSRRALIAYFDAVASGRLPQTHIKQGMEARP